MFFIQIIAIVIVVIIGLLLKFILKNKRSFYIENGNSKKIKQIRFIQVIILIVIYIVTNIIGFNYYRESNQKYDLFGKSYSSVMDIPFYDEYGNQYHFFRQDGSTDSFYISEDNTYYNAEETYITKGGYIVFIDETQIKKYIGIYEIVSVEGEHYYAVIHPYWNKNGDLIVNDNGRFGNGDIIITKEEQLDYQKEKNVKLYNMIAQN